VGLFANKKATSFRRWPSLAAVPTYSELTNGFGKGTTSVFRLP